MLRTLIVLFLSTLLSSYTLAGRINHINILVSNADEAAKSFALRGFVLKKPHIYKAGVQKGLISQAIHFKSGQYLQLMSIDPKQKKSFGALALWYQKYLSETPTALGLSIVLEALNLEKLSQKLLHKSIPNRFKEFSKYRWLSFKTNSPYQHLSFINQKQPIQRNSELFNHHSKAYEIHKIDVALKGDPSIWSIILQLSGSSSVGLNFSSLTYQSKGVIQRITLKSGLKKCPSAFQVGQIKFSFLCPSTQDKGV